MGEGTPEAIEIQCPGCGSRFRLTPKKGRLPSRDIPCPKCSEEIPVTDDNIVGESPSSRKEGDDTDEKRSSSAPGFGVMSPTRKANAQPDDDTSAPSGDADGNEPASSDDGDGDDAIAQLERMAEDLPAGSTMAGLPGVGSSRDGSVNPFQKSRNVDKTTQVDPSVLERVAADTSESDDDAVDAGEGATDSPPRSESETPRKGTPSWSADQPDTSPRLVSEQIVERLADESSSAVVGSNEELPDQDKPPRLRGSDDAGEDDTDDGSKDLRDTAENKSIASRLRETAENKSVASKLGKARGSDDESKQTQLGHPAVSRNGTSDDTPTTEVDKASILGRIKAKKKRVPADKDDAEEAASQEKESSDKLSPLERLKKLKEKKKAGKTEGDESSDSEGDDDGASLSKLFKKVQNKRGADSRKLKDKLKSTEKDSALPKPADSDDNLPIAKEVELSEDELADIVDQTTDTSDEGDELLGDAAADQSAPLPVSASGTAGTDDGSHDDLFADVESPKPAEPPLSDGVGSVSKKRGETTTQSMLARLQKRRDGDANDPKSAGEKRGSGYIRLPTTEIQDVLGQGDFRLKIEGVVYEPVDKDGLIKLIKGGVLLGAEELAEGNGDWMPVSEHPVFGELRRKMASEAHHVLSRLGLQQKKADEAPDDAPPPKPAAPDTPSVPDASSASGDQIPAAPPTTEELDASEQEQLRVGMTDKQFVIDADDQEAKSEETSPAKSGAATDADAKLDAPSPPESDEEASDTDAQVPALSSDDGPPAQETDGPVDRDDEEVSDPSAEDIPTPETDTPSESTAAPPLEATPEPAPAPSDAGDEFDDTLQSFGDQELVEAEKALEHSQAANRSKVPIAIGVVAGVAILVGGGLLFTDPGQELLDDLSASPAEEVPDESEPEVASELVEAVEYGKDTVADARDVGSERADAIVRDPSEADADAWIQERLEEDAYADVVELMTMQWDEGRRDAAFLGNYSRALIESAHYNRARRVALVALSEAPDEQFTALHRRAVTEDEQLTSYDYVELTDPAAFSAAGVYDQSNHRGLVIENGDKFDGTLIFKPETSGRTNHWRVEIAAWRFCELIACHFQIFEVQPAVMTRGFIDDLTGDTDGFDDVLSGANWSDLDDLDDDAVRGSLEYVPDADAVPFPLGGPGPWLPEWRRWVSAAGVSAEVLDEPVAENLDALGGELDDDHYQALLATLDDATTGDVARQISALITFDFLFNNPDRITRLNAPDAGVNKPIVDSTMVARHNGDAFSHLRISRRVRDRLGWTTRHSRSTVASIRALDREILADVLFPEATAAERQLVDAIWQQRNALRDQVDDLISQRSEDEVLHFP